MGKTILIKIGGNALGEAGVREFAVSQLRMIFDDASDDTGRLRENIGPEIWGRAQAIRPPVGGDASATHPQVDGGASSVNSSQLELILQQQSKIAQGQVDALNALANAQAAQTERKQHNGFLTSLQKVSGVAKPKTLNVFDCSLTELNHWVDNLLHYVQHVDVKSKALVDLIVQLRNCTFSSTDWSAEEQRQQNVTVTNMAEQNYANMLSQCPPAQREEPKLYAELDPQVMELDYQMYGYTISLIHQGSGEHSAEVLQYKDKVQGDDNFASFVELILYVYSTKIPSPIHQWLQECHTFNNLSKTVPEQWIHSATRIIDSERQFKKASAATREPKPEVKEVRQVKTTVGKCVDCNKSGVDTTKGHKRCVDCHRKYIAAFQPKPKNRGKPEQATAQTNTVLVGLEKELKQLKASVEKVMAQEARQCCTCTMKLPAHQHRHQFSKCGFTCTRSSIQIQTPTPCRSWLVTMTVTVTTTVMMRTRQNQLKPAPAPFRLHSARETTP